jgi:hypothetical protein
MESKTPYQQFSGAINECFSELTDTMTNCDSQHHAISVTLYDQYLDRLYTDDGDINYEQWNQSTVDAMKADIAKLKNQVRDGF